MLFKYLKSSFMSIRNNKLIACNAIISLSVGFLIFTLLLAFCLYYYDYDKQVDNHENWYRLRKSSITPDFQETNSTKFFYNLLPAIQAEIPEIEEFIVYESFKINLRFTNKDGDIVDVGGLPFVSKNFIEHYNLKFIYGDPYNTEYENMPFVVSRSYAMKYFGREDVVGEKIFINKTWPRFVIAGVYDDIPENYHLKDNAFRFKIFESDDDEKFQQSHVRVRISDKSKLSEVQEKITQYLSQFEQETSSKFIAKLDPIHKIHFIQGLDYDLKTMNINIVHASLLVAILLLITAFLNFINLNSLIWQKRSNEFLFRKTLGASRYDIIKQLFTEYSLLYIISLAVFLVLFYFSNEIFNQWINLNLGNYQLFNNMITIQIFIYIFIFGWLISFISIIKFAKFNEISEETRAKSKRVGNNFILFIQIAVSVVFVISAIIIYNQSKMIKNFDIGFAKDNLVEYSLFTSDKYGHHYPSFERVVSELKNIPEIEKFTYSGNSVITKNFESTDNLSNVKGKLVIYDTEYFEEYSFFGISSGFPKTLGIRVLFGTLENFIPYNQDEPEDVNDIIVNKVFMDKFFPNSNPVGRTFSFISDVGTETYTIKAVLDNVYFQSIYKELKPTYYGISDIMANYFQIYFREGMADIGIEKTDKVFNDASSETLLFPVRINVAQSIDEYYAEDNLYLTIIMILAIISTLIALFGVYGISSLHIFSKLKEISIHKINGAGIKDIFKIFGKSYIIITTAGFITGSLLAWYITDIFLKQYSVIIDNLYLYYGVSFLIISTCVFIPVFFNISKAYFSQTAKYLNNE